MPTAVYPPAQPVHVQPQPSDRMTTPADPASLPRRLAAAFYDLLLVSGLWFVAVFALLPFTHGHAIHGSNPLFRLYLLTVAYLFFSWFWTRSGQTLGMRAWRLQLRSYDGKQVGWLQALLRYIAAWVAWLSVIGILWCLVDKQKRCWQDIFSHTQVVTRPKGS